MDPSAALTATTTSSTTILELVLLLVWNCLCVTPERQKHPIYVRVFPSNEVLQSVSSACSLAFAPGLFEVLQASEPPSIAYFKNLPTYCKKLWAVYLLVLEKSGYRPKIYIGSGTDSKSGAPTRLS